MGLLSQTQLAGRKRFSFTGWTHVLPGRRFMKRVIETEFGEHRFQIRNMDLRGKRLPATNALHSRPNRAFGLVKLYTKLCRPLKYVKELSKWQIKQSGDHRHRVQNGQEIVEIAAQPRCGRRECKASHRNR